MKPAASWLLHFAVRSAVRFEMILGKVLHAGSDVSARSPTQDRSRGLSRSMADPLQCRKVIR